MEEEWQPGKGTNKLSVHFVADAAIFTELNSKVRDVWPPYISFKNLNLNIMMIQSSFR